MRKNDKLNNLFLRWKKRYPKDKSFYKDGIVDETLYRKAPVKILIIAKEPNSKDSEGSMDFRVWWQESLDYGFSFRIAEWAHGINNNFPLFQKLWAKDDGSVIHQSIKEIAFMNVKKTGGGGRSKKLEINEHIQRDFEFIHDQIDIIKPDVIITGISWVSTRSLLFPDVEWIECGYHIDIGKYKSSKVIDFYHPSARNAPSASYSLLQNVFRSRKFKNL